jgi:hypothetical protein
MVDFGAFQLNKELGGYVKFHHNRVELVFPVLKNSLIWGKDHKLVQCIDVFIN